MVIIGEKLNSSVPAAMNAFAAHDADAIMTLARAQMDYGANYLDLNAAMTQDEKADLLWAARLITDSIGAPLVIDTPSAEVADYVYAGVKLKDSIINSVTLEPERFNSMMELVKQYHTGVVALPVRPDGMPKGADERVEASRELIEKITEQDVSLDRIYLDLVVEAAGADASAPLACIEAARSLRKLYPGIHILAGLSNVSFGLPRRASLNSAYLSCLMTAGADTFIMDPTREQIILAYRATELLLGYDEYCMEYIALCRQIAER